MFKPTRLTIEQVKKFEQLAMLNDDEIYVWENRIKGMTVLEMSDNLKCSPSTIHRMIRKIGCVYDVIQEKYPKEFPKRFVSKEEIYMDTH